MRILFRLLIVSFLAAATSLQAITYIVPTDRDLVKRAEAIVIATAVESHSELREGGRIVTVATLQVESVLKGSVGDSVQLVEMGGAVGDRAMVIPGSPRYESGKRYLVFLRTNKFGERVTYGFGLGKFAFTSDIAGRQLLTRGATNDQLFGFEERDFSSHVERIRAATGFLRFVDTVAKADGPAREDYLLDQSSVVLATFPEFSPRATRFIPIAESTRPDYMLSGNYRWPSPSATFVYCCSPTFEPGFNGPSDISSAMSSWNGAGAGVNYTLGAVDNAANKGFTASDCKNAVLFNDPNNEITGAAAIGGISTTGTTCRPPPQTPIGPFTYNNLGDGVTYSSTLEVDVVVGKSISTNETTFIGILTHELGHTLGFRHADGTADPLSPQNGHPCVAPSPCAGQGSAVMASVIAFNLSALQQWDLDAVQTVYGSGPVCTPPSIGTQPANATITAGQQTTLTVAATGTSLTYQWYIGNAGTTTTPAPNGTGTQLTVSPGTTTNYWVRVTGQCAPTADSRTAIVTVNCGPPSVSAPLASPSSIASGQSSILSASPTGTGPFTYQWYIGNSGATANPINGATSSSTSVSPTTTTSYWVRVTGQCAPVADSPSTTVTVGACVPPSAPTPLASPSSISTGQSSSLSVSASGTGPLTYQWFAGNSGDQSNPIAGATGFSTTVSPTATTNYWVKVTGQCAPAANSPATTVTVACTPIAAGGVGAQPPTINVGQSSTISATTSGSGPFTFQWYRGSLGDFSNPIATTSSTLVSPATSTTYWVRVTAPCGSQDGSTTVFVNAPCTASSIATNPAFATIAPGASATLTVTAAGTAPISYQWYAGTSGNTSNPIAGATNASVTVTPAATTSYWVRVSNSCNTIGNNSTTAVVTVSANCPAATITTQPASVSAGIGTAATLKVIATVTGTTIHYQWYKGAKGDLSTKVGTDSDTFTTSTVAVTASYWVRLTSACSNLTFTDSNAAIVTAVATPKGRAVRH